VEGVAKQRQADSPGRPCERSGKNSEEWGSKHGYWLKSLYKMQGNPTLKEELLYFLK